MPCILGRGPGVRNNPTQAKRRRRLEWATQSFVGGAASKDSGLFADADYTLAECAAIEMIVCRKSIRGPVVRNHPTQAKRRLEWATQSFVGGAASKDSG